ncbi:MAG: polyphosphate kinase 1 [Gammaproteobacteria bacterium]|nr:MAG: polyphosphate kinase 1 [Gammaproteobacteria bacterium]
MANAPTKSDPPVSLTVVATDGKKTPATGESDGRTGNPAPRRRKTTVASEVAEFDLSSAEFYLNRELTWLEFNRRVLFEAQESNNLLMERVKFAAIVGGNLDEFFMKRIGGLKQQVGAGLTDLTVDGRTPQQQIAECREIVHHMEHELAELVPELFAALALEGISVLAYEDLSEKEREATREFYFNNIFPLITPQVIDPAHPFPFISNLSLNLLVTVRQAAGQDTSMARVKVPVGAGIPRLVRVGEADRFVLLEDVMANNLDLLFPEVDIESCEEFRVTRNANTERDEDNADDLMDMIEAELRDRRFAPIVRLKVRSNMDPVRRGMLAFELGLDEETDVFDAEGMLGTRDLWELAGLERPDLKDPAHHPITHPRLMDSRNIFHIIREAGSILLQHPYESFSTSVERFLKEASHDPNVRAIKMTLYRTSSDTKVVDYLVEAAQRGKQVAVVVELKARFDEAANIRWAGRMEEAGVHVTYGVLGLKTHCKVISVVRKDYSGLRRYLHIGTGNYHAGTARLYSDLGLLTCDDDIGQDATELFNFLTTGYTPDRKYRKLLLAPKVLKKALLNRIKREIKLHKKTDPGLIRFKTNALEDVDITRALYEASQAGVRLGLILGDTCRLRPGIKGLSESVRVISVVGRFLEHSRIYYFRNGGEEEYFIGSADLMKRNLKSRVEVVTPVEDAALREQLREFMDTQLLDARDVWEMQSDGSYKKLQPDDADAPGSQETIMRLAEKRQKAATQMKKKKRKGGRRRNLRR